MSGEYKTHFILPDCQIRPGVPLDHLAWAANYCVTKKPDRIICIGDFADFPSLSSYDIGKKSFEGRTYLNDIEVAREAMGIFMSPILREIERTHRNHRRQWNPTFDFFEGNHEERNRRAVNSDRKLEGLVGVENLRLEEWGWKYHPFLEVAVLDGIAYSHYFTSGSMGRPVTSASALARKKHMSCVMGHVQKRDIAYEYTGDGRQITCIFTGVFYQHDEEYLGPQGNKCWRGVWVLNNVKEGEFDEKPISLRHLKEKYGN
jgi:hypothetical protein